MNYNYEEILRKLPASWEDITVLEFTKLTELLVTETDATDNFFVGVDNTLKVLSVLTGLPVEDLEAMPMQQINRMASKLDFMTVLPKPNKNISIKWKSSTEITYGDFILYQQFSTDLFNNIHLIIPAFSKTKLTPEDVLMMNMVDINTAFFAQEAIKEITQEYSSLFKAEIVKTDSEGVGDNTFQNEINASVNEDRKNYGWHLLAKDVADFTNVTFYQIFELTAQEIFSTLMVMQARVRINQNKLNAN